MLVVYLLVSGSPADIKEQQPQFTNGDGYQQMVGKEINWKRDKPESKIYACMRSKNLH